MTYEIGLLPSGHLHCYLLAETSTDTPFNHRVAKAFNREVGEGLFELAVRWKNEELSANFIYWHRFATQYLKAGCLETSGNWR